MKTKNFKYRRERKASGPFLNREANFREEDTFDTICSFYTQQQAAKVVSKLEIALSARHGSQRLDAPKG